MKTSNPALSEKNFRNLEWSGEKRMTVQGTINKSFVLIALVIVSAVLTWSRAFPGGWGERVTPQIPMALLPAGIVAFVLSLAIIFKKNWAPFLAPLYAVTEGMVLGALSAVFEFKYPGIASQAMLSTFGTFVAMLMAYRSGLIQATDKFKLGVITATGGIALVYVTDMVLGMLGIHVPFIHDNGTFGIIVSLVIVGVAALNLILDFDFIEKASATGAPKYMEWYSAFGLLVTLVWLYIEILRLLGKGRSRQ